MPAYPNHQDIRPAYVQAADPGVVGAGVFWVDTSVGPPFVLKVRDLTDTGWDTVGASSSSSGGGTLPGPPGLDAEEPEMPYVIPGPPGPAGSSSSTSSQEAIERTWIGL